MIYFDNASTTQVFSKSIEKAVDIMGNNFGNPSSLHDFGFRAEQEIITAQKIISKSFPKGKIIFTSGASESNFTAVLGLAKANKGNHIITTVAEHDSVLLPMKRLEQLGYDVTYIPVDSSGCVSAEQIESSVRSDTVLVSIIHVNNETGVINCVENIAERVKKINSNICFHTDAVQSFLKMKLDTKNIDSVSISGHKVHAPKGVGALYIKDNVKMTPFMEGSQQGGFRAGTENVAAIAAFGMSCKLFDSDDSHVKALKERFANGLQCIENVVINGGMENISPYILNASIIGVMSETIVHSLESKGIYISNSSSCNSKSKKNSHVITAMTSDKKIIESAVRFSFCNMNTAEEIDSTLNILNDTVKMLRKLN